MASNEGDSGDLPRGLLGRNRGRAARLPSIRAPRDLTLGGAQKKTFVPNIPARPRERNKDDKQDSEGGRGDRKGGRGKGGRGGVGDKRGRGRGRGRGADLIQTQSIFEQGAADRSRPRISHEPVERGSSSAAPGRPVSNLKREKNEETKRVLDNLLRDDFVEGEGLRGSDPTMDPIQLPLYNFKSDLKEEVKVKDEPDVEMTEATPAPAFKPVSIPPIKASELFTKAVKSEHGELILLQLPDTLPGEPPDSADKDGKKSELTDSQEDLSARLGLCSLRDFSDGYIGKLQIHKSGRTRLVLGNVSLDVGTGTPTGFLQEVVSCRIDGQSGDMSVLGHVQHKMVCSPDFESMLDNS